MIVDCAVYEDGRRRAGELALSDAYEAGRSENAFVWIGLYEPTTEEFESVRLEFDLHELAVEDAIKAHQRPKLEIYGDSLLVVLKSARYLGREDLVELGEILLFIGEGFVVSVRHGEASALHEVRMRAEKRPDLLRCGPSAVLHAIVDRVVDDYQPVVASLEQDIHEIESEVFSSTRANPGERIYMLKREVLELQGAVAPLLEPLERLTREEHPLVAENIRPYFRDVHDHLVRVAQQVDNFGDLLTSVLTANLTKISVRQNDDVRKISAWAAIIAIPTMVAGIYGMNFEHMPELGWRFGYPLVLAVVAAACFLLYRRFRQSGWL